MFFGIAGGLVILDQITKALIRASLTGADIAKPLGNDLLWFVHIQNPGLAFGLTFLSPLMLAVISAVASVALGWFIYKNANQSLWQNIPLSFIMGGAIGNLIDRVVYGQVTDFISVDLPDFLMDRFFVFNVADSSVSVGVALLLIASFFPEPALDHLDESQPQPPSEAEHTTTTAEEQAGA